MPTFIDRRSHRGSELAGWPLGFAISGANALRADDSLGSAQERATLGGSVTLRLRCTAESRTCSRRNLSTVRSSISYDLVQARPTTGLARLHARSCRPCRASPLPRRSLPSSRLSTPSCLGPGRQRASRVHVSARTGAPTIRQQQTTALLSSLMPVIQAGYRCRFLTSRAQHGQLRHDRPNPGVRCHSTSILSIQSVVRSPSRASTPCSRCGYAKADAVFKQH